MGNGSSKYDSMQISDQVAHIGFPQTLNLAWKSSFSESVMIVSTSKGSNPLYSACIPSGHAGPTVLYPGKDVKRSPMGYVERNHNTFTISLPEVSAYGIQSSRAIMKYEHPYSKVRYSFTMPVGNGRKKHIESFEWRRSSGKEVKAVGMSSSGWKLVRTTPSSKSSKKSPQNKYRGGASVASGPSLASDGKEVVAVLAEAKSFTISLTEVGGFQYLGSGIMPDMGYHWALMALLSGIALFQHQKSQKIKEDVTVNVVDAVVNGVTN